MHESLPEEGYGEGEVHEAEEEDCGQHLNAPSGDELDNGTGLMDWECVDLRDTEDRLAVVVGVLV